MKRLSEAGPIMWRSFTWSFDISVLSVFLGPVYIFYGLVVFIGTFGHSSVLKDGINSFTGPFSDGDLAKRIGGFMGILLILAFISFLAGRFNHDAPDAMIFIYFWEILWIVATVQPLFYDGIKEGEVFNPLIITASLKSERLSSIATRKNVAHLASGHSLTSNSALSGVFELIEAVYYGAVVRPITEGNSKAMYELGVRGLIINNDDIILLTTIESESEALDAAQNLAEARTRHLYQSLADELGHSEERRVAGWVIHPGEMNPIKIEGFGVKFTSVPLLLKAFRGVYERHKEEVLALMQGTAIGEGVED